MQGFRKYKKATKFSWNIYWQSISEPSVPFVLDRLFKGINPNFIYDPLVPVLSSPNPFSSVPNNPDLGTGIQLIKSKEEKQ